MVDQIVITEKTSQAKDVRAAVGSRYGDILPAEGHLFDLEVETLVADPAPSGRALRHPADRWRQQGIKAQGHSRGVAHR